MYRILELLKSGSGISRTDYLQMMKRNPGVEFDVQPNQLQPYPTLMMADEIIMDLTQKHEMMKYKEEERLVLFSEEHYKIINRVSGTVDGILNSIEPYLAYLEDVEKECIVSELNEEFEVRLVSNIPFLQSLVYSDAYIKKSPNQADTARYISNIRGNDKINLELFVLCTHKPKFTIMDIVEICKDGTLRTFLNTLKGLVESERTASDLTETKSLKIETLLTNDVITVVKLAKSLMDI